MKKVILPPVSKGKEFEDHVADLYRLMGYEIKQNVGILGHQIDIILSYTMPGGIEANIAVECKYVEKGNLRKNDVMENILALADLERNKIVQKSVIVTTHGFAKDVWDTAQANSIHLITFNELHHQIIQLDHYLDRLIEDFETDEVSTYYVVLAAQDDEHLPTKIFGVDEYVHEWINNDEMNHLSLLGEYGTGKTTFCRKLAHDLAVQYREDVLTRRIPILITLRDYSRVMTVRQLITDLLINEYGFQGINFSLFEKMNEEGLFLLIVDGFDEMAQKVVFDVAYANFSKIAELAKPEKSKVILTCRTEFFRTHEQEKEILLDIDNRRNFSIIYLREFDDEQTRKFLQKRVPLLEEKKKEKQGWEPYYQKIQEIFDLRDLAKRPVLLELITKYLPHLVEKGAHINASTLYRTTIHEELKRRLRIGKTVIRKEDRINLMKLLAAWMYNNDTLSVHYRDIPELLDLKMHFDLNTRADIEYHLHDFLTCSFLRRDAEGNYRFSHRSFVDFLVAYKFVDDIEKDFKDDFGQKKITYEVMQIMKDFQVNKARLYEWIASTKNKSFSEAQYVGGNAGSLLHRIGENFANTRFDFSETLLDYANLHGADLEGLDFQYASLKFVSLNNAHLVNTNFSFANLEGATFGKMNKIFSVCWSPDGKYLVSGDEIGILKIWERKNFKGLATVKGHTLFITRVAFSPDGKYVASGSWDETGRVWDLHTLKEIAMLKGHSDYVFCVAYSPDGKYVATGSRDSVIKIWDVHTGEAVAVLKGHAGHVFCVAYSPDGKVLASGGLDKTVRMWDVQRVKEVAVLKGHNDGVFCVAYSPDGKYVATGSWDETGRVWDVGSFSQVAVLKGHTRSVDSIAYSPDGKYVATGSRDSIIKIWDVDTFNEVAALTGHTDEVCDIAYSPDGNYLASGSCDKTIRIWDVNPRSTRFGTCGHIIMQQINCMGMKIKGIRGIKEERIEFLKERGAED